MNVGEMQRKLSLWAEQNKERRFYGLYKLLYDSDWLRLAHDYVKQNAGSVTAGCDGINLRLSMEKTKITHLNDGFQFLGFRIQRRQGHNGMKTKVFIPPEAVDQLKSKIAAITDPVTHQDSVNTKILALNRIIGGWCRYYQYTSCASTIFNRVENQTFWKMVHWLGRKFQITTPVVLTRYKKGDALATATHRLKPATEFQPLIYKKRFLKPNPYTTQEVRLQREELPQETFWTGCEPRPGIADLRPLILEMDKFKCQLCGQTVTVHTAKIDHIEPVRRFKRPVDANVMSNLWTLCASCHQWKTEYDRQMESCGAVKVARPVR